MNDASQNRLHRKNHHPDLKSCFINVAETAVLLGITERAIRARNGRRTLPFKKIGGRVMFSRDELFELIEESTVVTLGEAVVNLKLRS